MTRDNYRLMLYDRRTAALSELFVAPEGRLGDNPIWSADGRFIYIDAPFSSDPRGLSYARLPCPMLPALSSPLFPPPPAPTRELG